MFALLWGGGEYVVKLPNKRVIDLVASADGERFDPRHDGKLMKEWILVKPMSKREWPSLGKEAMRFVSKKH
jgi:hypothetical protein